MLSSRGGNGQKIDNNHSSRDHKISSGNQLQDMSQTLTAIHDIMKDDTDSKKRNGDWVQLTLVLDRVFFAIFVITIFASVSAIMGKAPKITM